MENLNSDRPGQHPLPATHVPGAPISTGGLGQGMPPARGHGGYAPARGLATAALVLAGVVAVLDLVEVPFAWAAGGKLADAAARGIAPTDVLTAYDAVGLLYVGPVVAAWVTTALWLSTARDNAHALAPGAYHVRGRVWAWLGWIVPIVNFWFPYQYVRDVREATGGSDAPVATQQRSRGPASACGGACGWATPGRPRSALGSRTCASPTRR